MSQRPLLALALLALTLLAPSARALEVGPAFDTLFGLRRGATAADLERALGVPDRTEPGDDPTLRFAIHPFDPGQPLPPTLDVTLCGDTGLVCSFALELPARDAFARRAPVFDLLGLTRDDLTLRLGPPEPGSLRWRWSTADAPGSATLSLTLGPDGRASYLALSWHLPTEPGPAKARLATFTRFAGLARGDREDRVQAVLGPPTSATVDTRDDRRRLEYPGLVVRVDRTTGHVTSVSMNPDAAPFLASRGVDEPNLWVVGKSASYLRRRLGKPAAKADLDTWHHPSARAPQATLTAICEGAVVAHCDTAIVDWFVPADLAPLPKLTVADFARLGPLVYGDTEVELRQKLGEPTRVTPSERGGRFFDYGDGAFTVLVDPEGRIDIVMIRPGARGFFAERGLVDPRLDLLGRKRKDLVRALGRPDPDSDAENVTWWTPPGAPHKLHVRTTCYDFNGGLCQDLVISW